MKINSIFLILGISLAACNDTYINHKIEFRKIGECGQISPQVQMESNVMGDRYHFNQCLPNDFNEKDYSVNRKGDTLVVSFSQKEGQPQSEYVVTLDIDANPRYDHIQIGNQVLAIGAVE
jgi:hypothetical protein